MPVRTQPHSNPGREDRKTSSSNHPGWMALRKWRSRTVLAFCVLGTRPPPPPILAPAFLSPLSVYVGSLCSNFLLPPHYEIPIFSSYWRRQRRSFGKFAYSVFVQVVLLLLSFKNEKKMRNEIKTHINPSGIPFGSHLLLSFVYLLSANFQSRWQYFRTNQLEPVSPARFTGALTLPAAFQLPRPFQFPDC